MAMHIIADFEQPLSPAAKRAVLLAVAPLAKAQRVRFVRGDHRAVVIGDSLGLERVRAVFTEADLQPTSLTSSLAPAEQDAVDEAGDQAQARERIRPIGR